MLADATAPIAILQIMESVYRIDRLVLKWYASIGAQPMVTMTASGHLGAHRAVNACRGSNKSSYWIERKVECI